MKSTTGQVGRQPRRRRQGRQRRRRQGLRSANPGFLLAYFRFYFISGFLAFSVFGLFPVFWFISFFGLFDVFVGFPVVLFDRFSSKNGSEIL
jgi:hypothetical protein